MKESMKLLGVALFSLASVAGCAAEPVEALDGANAALAHGSSLTSPLANGLYSDGAGGYIRASKSYGKSADGAVLAQQVEWAFAGFDRGTGSADVPSLLPGNDRLDVKQVWTNVTRTLSIVVGEKSVLDVVERSTDGSTPVHRSFSPVAYRTLNASYGAQTTPTSSSELDASGVDTFGDYGVTIREATEDGVDLVVTGPRGTSSSAHFTWDARALRLSASSCGGLALSLGGSHASLEVTRASTEQPCAEFSALRGASLLGIGEIELQKR